VRKRHSVTVLGLGHIGLPTALAIALSGYRVIGVDINSDRVKAIQTGQLKISEPGFDEKLRSALESGALNLRKDFDKEGRDSDVCLICVQTPLGRHREPDLQPVLSAVRTVASSVRAGSFVSIHSSLPPCTTRTKIAPLLTRRSGLQCGKDFWLAVSPERMTPSQPLKEIFENPRVVGGYTNQCAKVAASFYASFVKGPLFLTDATVAEASKLAENAFRDVNIAFANELALLCEKLRVPVQEVIRIANTHPRVHILNPGPGVGGPCLPKDPLLLLSSAGRLNGVSVIRTARRINDSMPEHAVKLVRQSLRKVGKTVRRSRIAVLGLAYKSNVDDIRNSPALKIISLLERDGALVRKFDPLADRSLDGNRCDTLDEAFDRADCIVILAEHDAIRDLDLLEMRKLTSDHPVIVDGRGLFTEQHARESGFLYSGIGFSPNP